MNYEKIIVELLDRIKTLEEQMEMLLSDKEIIEEDKKMTTSEIRRHIESLKANASKCGKSTLIITARDIHGELNLKSRYPMVCNAMRQCMNSSDVILFQPPKGNSSTLEIEYKL